MTLMCTGTSGKRGEPCGLEARYVDTRGRVWCGVHADRAGCQCPPLDALPGLVAYHRALQPAGGTVSDGELRALGSWAQPAREHRSAWAARVRQLLAESPLRDLASAAIEARAEVGRGMAAAARRRPQDARSERGRGEVAARRSRGSEGRGGRSAPQIAKGWPSCLPASTFSTPAAKTRS